MEFKKQQKPFTVEEQIKNLHNLGLIIEDEIYAKNFLNDVSYFRLVKAYSLGLKPKNGNYYPGVTFDDIVELYKFNCKFRQQLFPIIERIEVNLRCRLANYFSSKYGVLGYEDARNFRDPKHHTSFLEDIKNEITRNAKSPFVKNFRDNYENGKIPFYALVELFSFGTLSKFFKNMKNEDKKAVSLTYGVSYKYFESWIESIAFVRMPTKRHSAIISMVKSTFPEVSKLLFQTGIINKKPIKIAKK
jgi:abortive infection bacteriophage resistance protein